MARLRDPRPQDATLPADADRYLRHNPDDEEVREARERSPSLDESEWSTYVLAGSLFGNRRSDRARRVTTDRRSRRRATLSALSSGARMGVA